METTDRQFFFVKISCPKEGDNYEFGRIIENLVHQKVFTADLNNIPYRLDEARENDIIFLQIGGDSSNKTRYFSENPNLQNFTNGIYGIGLLNETNSGDKTLNAKFYGFEEPVTKKQLYYFPQFIDSLGASTKGIPNQAGLYQISENEAKSFIDYLKREDIVGISGEVLNSIESDDYLNQIAKDLLSEDDELYSKSTEIFLRDVSNEKPGVNSRILDSNTKFEIDNYFSSLTRSGLIVDKFLVSRFLLSVISKPFTILTGLSGSGKSQIAISLAKWITGGKSKYYLLSKALNDEVIKDNYDLVRYSENTVELINRSGTSGKIIPLPVNLIFEWFDEVRKGNLTENKDPKNFKDEINERSNYQKYIQGFYNDLSKIAFTMAKYTNGAIAENDKQFEVVSVGADWTNREPLLGYPDAIRKKEYVLPESGVLQLILQAEKDPERPYFLILDEMNLSHVERYFADFLSAIESNEEIKLHSGEDGDTWNGIPSTIKKIPENLFIIGTVNIDETTYMFSPKVLDRANVIEFRVNKDEMENFLKNPADVDLSELEGKGAGMAKDFVKIATNPPGEFSDKEILSKELIQFFENLSEVGAEFGYRTANEISRFATLAEQLAEEWEFEQIMDAAISQKLLPKLHGSRRKLEGVLFKLAQLCIKEGDAEELLKKPSDINWETNVKYPISLEKILRMHKGLLENGFTSFAEA